jgi:hypothetical protein
MKLARFCVQIVMRPFFFFAIPKENAAWGHITLILPLPGEIPV